MFENGPQRSTTTRTAVVQRRGIERTQAILDAAEELLREQGYEAATLKAIGERAGIPTASLYHYFADRHQVEAELARRHSEGLDTRIRASIEGRRPGTLGEAIDIIVTPYLDYFRENPAFVQLWFASRTAGIAHVALAFDDEWANRFWRYLIGMKLIREDTPLLAAQITFEAGNRIFDLAFRHSPDGDEKTITELRRLVTAYLQTYAPQT